MFRFYFHELEGLERARGCPNSVILSDFFFMYGIESSYFKDIQGDYPATFIVTISDILEE